MIRLFLVLVAFAIALGTARAAEPPWRVVIIRNWDALYRVNVMREEGLRETLLENSPREVEIYPEQVDNLRFGKEYNAETAAVLRRQYRGIRIDLVIATGLEPLEFAALYRDQVWPGAAIVFMGVTDGWLEGWKRPPRTTGITTILDVAGTLELGLALKPRARRVYFIAGTSEFDQSYLRQAQDVASRFAGRLEARYIVGESRERIIESTAHVEPDSLLMYLTVLRDSAGQYGGPYNTILSKINERSPAPLLSAVHTQWNRGPVGGSSSRSDEHGRAGGRLARRVLEGADPDVIPVSAFPVPTCEVDWRALQRWAIPEGNVPASCTVTNRAPQIWRDYFWEFLALLTIIIVQFGLLWLVVEQSRARRLAEQQLRDRAREMARVGRLAAMGELAASIAHEVNQPISAILANAEAAKMMLDRGTLDDGKLRQVLEDICHEDMRAVEVIRGVRKMFARGEPNRVPADINTEVADALHHLAPEAARRGTPIEPRFGADLPSVLVDTGELHQIVVNLLVNAMDALGDEPEASRSIRVETRAVAGGVEIAVADNGPGLAATHASQLFDASFTTKAEGMGFGLPIVKTIVDRHGGRVHFEPNKPRGAVFRVWLPA
jgi:signal transduction histidine kinase